MRGRRLLMRSLRPMHQKRRRKVATDMGSQILTTNGAVLQSRPFLPPGNAIIHAIFAEHESAYKRGRLRYRFTARGVFAPPRSRWAQTQAEPAEEKSLIPCMTAVAIEVMKLGGIGRRYRRVEAKGATE